MKMRSLAIGLGLLTAGSVIGVSTQQFASADVSSGDRPVLVPIEPCRLVDTRPGGSTVGPRSSPLGTADTLTVDAQEANTDCTGAIPTDALSLSLNVTAIGATEQTFVTIWPGGTRPDASSLNPAPGAPPTPNAVTVSLSIDQEFEIYNNLGTVNLIVDVNGYYANHNHDDRYYTKAQTNEVSTAGFAIASDQTTIEIEASLFDDPDVANSTTVAVPGPGQLLVTVTGTYSAMLGNGFHPQVQCSLTDDGTFDSDHRSAYEVWNAPPVNSSSRSEVDLAITRVIDVAAAGDIQLDLLCRQLDGEVLVVSSIIAQYIP